jgi:AraC-like DNA-binding protein
MPIHLPAVAPGPVSLVLPPYAEENGLRWGGEAVPRGSVFLIDVADPESVCTDALRATVEVLRRGHNASVAIRLAIGCADSVRLVARCHSLGVRSVLLPGQPLRATLWRFLSNPVDLAGDWLEWVRYRVPVSLYSAHVITGIANHAAEAESVTRVSERIGISARTIRYHLGNDGLPNPERWFDAARLIAAELEMQRDPRLTPGRVASRLGYEDSHSFGNRVRSVFGHTVSVARERLGLDWRFAAWWALSQPVEGPADPGSRGRRAPHPIASAA